jgi:uncharacterized protein YjbI with pentapeptide repeats
MKVIKPLKQGLLSRTFEYNQKCYFVVTIFNYFPFTPSGNLHSEIDMWKFTAGELGKEALLDSGMPKPRGEVVIHGKFFSPPGRTRRSGSVRFTMAGMDKTLYVFGNRYWKQTADLVVGITDPEPMTSMDISYENAFGGLGFPQNPVGKGTVRVAGDRGEDLLPLPNIEDPRRLVASPKDRPEPAGFGPLDMIWPQRFSKAGTYDVKWLDERFPGLADDLDWSFYNTVSSDQQLSGFFEGNESFTIEGMHPEKALISAKLPGIRSRCFMNHGQDGDLSFRELALHMDTVWLFPHAEKGIVACRGIVEVNSHDAEDVKHLVLAYERLAEEERSLTHYQEALTKRLDPEKGYLFAFNEKDLIPPGEKSGLVEMEHNEEGKLMSGEGLLAANLKNRGEREKEKIRLKLAAAGVDPEKGNFGTEAVPDFGLDNLEDLEKVLSDAQRQQTEAEQTARKLFAEQGLDYDRAKEEAKKKPATQLRFKADDTIKQLRELGINDPDGEEKLHQTEAAFSKAYRLYGHLFPPALLPEGSDQVRMRDAVLAGLQHGESFAEKDLTGIDLRGLDLTGVDFKGAFLEGANFSEAILEKADLTDCVLVRANLKGAKCTSAKMTGAGLGEADLSGADLSGVDLAGSTLYKAKALQTVFRRANAEGVDFSEANLVQADMTEAVLRCCRFMESDLSNAIFANADLSEAMFLNTSMLECDFSGAKLSSAILVGVKGDHAVFKDTDLTNIRILKESSLKEADFTNAHVTQANLRGSNLAGSSFERADVSESDFGECNLQEARLSWALARQTRFGKADLTQARMNAVNLFGGSLQDARLYDTDLQGANLCLVDFMHVKFKNTLVGGANFAKTHIKRWISR